MTSFVSRPFQLALVALALLVGLGLGSRLRPGDSKPLAISGFAFELDVLVPGSPEHVFDLFTGDVSGWWDHHYVEKPAKLTIEPRPGGHFAEIFDAEGNGAVHATVTLADRGKVLIFRGPLGLGKEGVHFDMVHKLTFTAEGDATRLRLTVHAAGEVQEGWAQSIEGVWKHFLVERFQPWAEEHPEDG